MCQRAAARIMFEVRSLGPFLHCNYGETIDSPGKGTELIQLTSNRLCQGPEADGCKAVGGLTNKIIAIV